MKLDKTQKKLLFMYALFFLISLVIMPLFHSLFIQSTGFSSKIKIAFLSQKVTIAAAIMVFVLVLMVMRTNFRIKDYRLEWWYLFLGIIFISMSFITMTDLDSILAQGVEVSINKGTQIDLDSGRFSVNEFNTVDKEAKFVNLMNLTARKTLFLDSPIKDSEISFIVFSKNFSDSNFSLTVNNFTLNVSGLNHDSSIKNLKYKIDKEFVANENIVEIKGTGIYLLYESLFLQGRSFIIEDGVIKQVNEEAMIYLRQKDTDNLIYYMLFKFGTIFRLIGSVCFFIFSFGTGFSRKCMIRYKKEVLASLIFTLLFFLGLNLLQQFL